MRVHLDGQLIQQNPSRIAIEPLVEPPSGVTFAPAEAVDDSLDRPYHLRIARNQLDSVPRGFNLPLLIRLFDAEGDVLAEAKRSLNVTIQPGVRLVTEPADQFLGILEADDLPIQRRFTLSLEPPLPFRVVAPSGQVDAVHWEATPAVRGGDLCESWTLSLVLDAADGVGSRHHRLPLHLLCRDETGEWSQDFEMTIEYVALP